MRNWALFSPYSDEPESLFETQEEAEWHNQIFYYGAGIVKHLSDDEISYYARIYDP
jgi:hypothetical protein